MSTRIMDGEEMVRSLTRKVGRAIQEYRMIESGDRILVAVSGGKDSYTLLDLLERLRRRSPVRFELTACNVDQGYNGFRSDVIEDHLKSAGHRYHIEVTEIAHTIRKKMDPDDTHCSMCARLRRGVLYRLATELGCNKIALGHHADDIIETLLMLQLFNGQIKTMPPVLRAENGLHTVIRPMAYVWEREVIDYTRAMKFPVVCCCCPACGDTSLQRRRIKDLLTRLESDHPGIKTSLLKATRNVHLGFLLDPRYLLPEPLPGSDERPARTPSPDAAPDAAAGDRLDAAAVGEVQKAAAQRDDEALSRAAPPEAVAGATPSFSST